MPQDRFVVDALGLNLRTEARVAAGNVRGVLPQGHLVERLAVSVDATWWLVATLLDGAAAQGFVAHRFLVPAPAPPAAPVPSPPPPAPPIPPVHLTESRPDVTRHRAGGWALPLGEPGRPPRPAGNAAARAAALSAIVDWLAVEHSAHRRWARQGSTTFCNVYAHDYCYLAGVYLPRVWWTGDALRRIGAGEEVEPRYGATVHELNANALFDWLRQFGSAFGWTRELDLDALQTAVNGGAVAIGCAQRVQLQQPGHIVAVVPETAQASALRVGGEVTTPLQSEAGWNNHRRATRRWWVDPKFREVGFWRC